MATFRVAKSKDYTVMSNFHLRDSTLSLKAKGLLSQMLSLPEDWDYTLSGLAKINREGVDAIRTAVNELETAGYITRRQTFDESGHFAGNEYIIFEQPQQPEVPAAQETAPLLDFPTTENPLSGNPLSENPTELNIDIQSKDISKRKKKKKSAAPPELTPAELEPLIIECVRSQEHWERETKNNVYKALIAFYSPRSIKGNKPMPVKSQRGLNALWNKLLRNSNGNPLVILNALDDAVSNGWTTAYPKPDGTKSGRTAPQAGRRYEEI